MVKEDREKSGSRGHGGYVPSSEEPIRPEEDLAAQIQKGIEDRLARISEYMVWHGGDKAYLEGARDAMRFLRGQRQDTHLARRMRELGIEKPEEEK